MYKGVKTRFENVDLVIVRENMEDLYVGIEFEKGKKETIELIGHIEKLSGRKITQDSGISIKPISVSGIQKRMEHYACKVGLKASCHQLRHTMATPSFSMPMLIW